LLLRQIQPDLLNRSPDYKERRSVARKTHEVQRVKNQFVQAIILKADKLCESGAAEEEGKIQDTTVAQQIYMGPGPA
jgi:hypothetical protein